MVFDIGPMEFLALAVVAMLVLGPDKLPKFAADAARMLRQLRAMANTAKEDVRRELGPELQDISLDDLNPRTLIRKHVLDELDLDTDDDGDERPARNGRAGVSLAKEPPAEGSKGAGSKGAGSKGAGSKGTPMPYDDAT